MRRLRGSRPQWTTRLVPLLVLVMFLPIATNQATTLLRVQELEQLVDESRSAILGQVVDVRYGYDDIEERFGVIPERMADFLALMGDAVDNVPGVPGVGRKTAATLLKHFDTLPGVFENLDAVPRLKFRGAAFVAQSLREHRESAYLSRRLTGIACDMPLGASLDDLQPRVPDLAALDAFHEALGFGRLLRDQARRIADRHR